MRSMILIFITIKTISAPLVGDLTLVQIATNTLNSVRELNQIVSEQKLKLNIFSGRFAQISF